MPATSALRHSQPGIFAAISAAFTFIVEVIAETRELRKSMPRSYTED